MEKNYSLIFVILILALCGTSEATVNCTLGEYVDSTGCFDFDNDGTCNKFQKLNLTNAAECNHGAHTRDVIKEVDCKCAISPADGVYISDHEIFLFNYTKYQNDKTLTKTVDKLSDAEWASLLIYARGIITQEVQKKHGHLLHASIKIEFVSEPEQKIDAQSQITMTYKYKYNLYYFSPLMNYTYTVGTWSDYNIASPEVKENTQLEIKSKIKELLLKEHTYLESEHLTIEITRIKAGGDNEIVVFYHYSYSLHSFLDKDGDDGLSDGEIAGIAVGSVVGAGFIGGVIFYALKKYYDNNSGNSGSSGGVASDMSHIAYAKHVTI